MDQLIELSNQLNKAVNSDNEERIYDILVVLEKSKMPKDILLQLPTLSRTVGKMRKWRMMKIATLAHAIVNNWKTVFHGMSSGSGSFSNSEMTLSSIGTRSISSTTPAPKRVSPRLVSHMRTYKQTFTITIGDQVRM